MLVLTLLFVLALLLTAFLTAAELALFSLSESRLRVVVEEGFRGSDSLLRLRERPDRLLILLRVARISVAAGGAALVGAYFHAGWGGGGLVVAVVVAGLAMALVGELIPMVISASQSLRLSLAVAPVLLPVVRVLSPALGLLERLSRARPRPPAEAVGSMTEVEIRELTALGHTEGLIEEHERQLVERAFRLDETKAWEIMTPRVDVFAWPDSLTLDEIADDLRTVPFSRVPVYGESIDDITGVLYIRDAYQAVVAGRGNVTLRALAREPLVVPGSLPLTTLLRDFQGRRIHMAVVVDEYGGTDGLVTLEDVIEELVGEIVDETDVAEEPIVRISRNEIIAEGDADLREINHIFNTSFPQLEHRSLNGYLLEVAGRVPDAGETIEAEGVRITILESTDTQVVRARLVRSAPAPEGAEGPAAAEEAATQDETAAEAEAERSAGAPGGAHGAAAPGGPGGADVSSAADAGDRQDGGGEAVAERDSAGGDEEERSDERGRGRAPQPAEGAGARKDRRS